MESLAEILITELQGASEEKRFLISHNENFFQSNSITADLLRILKESSTQDEGIKKFLRINDKSFTYQQIKDLLDNNIMPKLNMDSPNSHQFLYQHTILKKEQINLISGIMSRLFNPYITFIVLCICLFLNIYFYIMNDDILLFREGINFITLTLLFIFMFLSSMFHEIGHAAACKHFGVSHGGIGIGLYLNFPVLYTDVTRIWQLSRYKRCIVNFAGVYFQCILLIVLLITYYITQFYLLRYMILIMDFGFLLTLNPFFKFDGYWIASDLLGVPNLRQRSREVVRYVFNYLFHRKEKNEMPYLLKMRSREKIGFVIYSILVNIFMGYYFLYIIPLFIYRFTASFPDEIYKLVLYLSNNINPPFALLRNIFSQALFMTLLVVLIFKFIKPFLKNKFKIF